MQNRIDHCFRELRKRGEKGFIAYICAGDPALSRTVDFALALERAGTDILELGVPFSDPLADGIVNQLAAQRALQAGATVRGVLSCVAEIRRTSQIPIVLYTYLNPIVQFGLGAFSREAEAAGVDGLLILDLPPDEDVEVRSDTISHIRLVAPTTPAKRLESICARGAGFIYYVSREGVTGAQTSVAVSLPEKIRAIRAATDLPIAVGFGISNPEHATEVAKHADAVVIGSAIVSQLAERRDDQQIAEKIERFVRPLVAATKAPRA
ncbi:MAG: tryptophan synthase subunit alpha [Chthoniobacterales bacterium]|nr:tryptophan synthase subunit alpha [Chthoniobacterales bacterium]